MPASPPNGSTIDAAARGPLFGRLADWLPTGLVQIDRQGQVIYANKPVENALGIALEDLTVDRLLALFRARDRDLLLLGVELALGHGEDSELELDVDANGLKLRCSIRIVSAPGPDSGPSAVVCVNDITRSARLRDELRARATFDVLTGCRNRDSVMTALEMALVDMSSTTGVLFIDLDDFKPVNDRLGHHVGDELLVAVARRLGETCRRSDIIGRIGGDEFLVVCRDLHDGAEAPAIAQRVHFALCHPFLLRAHTVQIGASIGIACSRPGMTAEELVGQADRAMYTAKRDGAGPVTDHS